MRKGFWTGLGLGLLLAGIIGVFFNVTGAVAGSVARGTSARIAEQAEVAGSADTEYRAPYDGYGWRGHHHFWGFPFLLLACLFPFLFVGLVFGLVRRMCWHSRRGWHHRRWEHRGEPVNYV